MSLAVKSFALFRRDIFLYAVRLITGAIIARILGPAAMGLWLILTMIPSYAEAFGRFKFDIAAVYYLGQKKYGLGETAFVLNVMALLSATILILIFIWKIDYFYVYLLKGSPNTLFLVYLTLLIIPLQFLFMNYSYLLIHMEDIKSYNSMLTIKELFTSLPALIALIILKWGLFSMVISALIGGVLSLLYGIWKVNKVERMKPHFNLEMIKDFIKYSSNLYLLGVIGQLNVYVSSLIVAFYLLPVQLAFFRIGQERAQLLNRIPEALSTILYPRISKLSNSEGEPGKLTAKSCRISFLLLSIIALIAAVLVKPLVIILYGQDYLPLTVPFWILLPGIVLSGSTGTLQQYFIGIGRPAVLLVVNTIPLIIQVIMGFIFIPTFGVIGAALTTTMAFIMLSIVTLIIFKICSRLTLNEIIVPNANDVKYVINFIRQRSLGFICNKNQREITNPEESS